MPLDFDLTFPSPSSTLCLYPPSFFPKTVPRCFPALWVSLPILFPALNVSSSLLTISFPTLCLKNTHQSTHTDSHIHMILNLGFKYKIKLAIFYLFVWLVLEFLRPSSGCLWTHYDSQTGIRLTEITLPLPPKCWGLKAYTTPHPVHSVFKHGLFHLT